MTGNKRVGRFGSWSRQKLGHADPAQDPTLDDEVNGFGFLMNRTGSFAVDFDSSSWPAGPQDVTAVLCDGWTNTRIDLGTVQIKH